VRHRDKAWNHSPDAKIFLCRSFSPPFSFSFFVRTNQYWYNVRRTSQVSIVDSDRRTKDFRYFAKVEISHGRVIVLDKVEGRLATSPFIETFTVLNFNEVHSAPTLMLIADRAWHEFSRELTLNSRIVHYVGGIFIKCYFSKNVPLTTNEENNICSSLPRYQSRLSFFEIRRTLFSANVNVLCGFIEQNLQFCCNFGIWMIL